MKSIWTVEYKVTSLRDNEGQWSELETATFHRENVLAETISLAIRDLIGKKRDAGIFAIPLKTYRYEA